MITKGSLIRPSLYETYKKCPYRYQLIKKGVREEINLDYNNALLLGSTMHKILETGDITKGINLYKAHFPLLKSLHFTEIHKMEFYANELLNLVSELNETGYKLHEINLITDVFNNDVSCTIDLLIKRPDGKFDLYDLKYCGFESLKDYINNSSQLHIYKFLALKHDYDINDLFYIYVPKINIKQKTTETIEEYNYRVNSLLSISEIEVVKIEYDNQKVIDFIDFIENDNLSSNKIDNKKLCFFCGYKHLCQSEYY